LSFRTLQNAMCIFIAKWQGYAGGGTSARRSNPSGHDTNSSSTVRSHPPKTLA
jgi:hypothetical protein